MNSYSHCGPLLYQASTEHNKLPSNTFDAFKDENANIVGNKLVFFNGNLYPQGILDVKVSISHLFTTNEPAYTVTFPIKVVDCSFEEDYFEYTKRPLLYCKANEPPAV